MVDAHAFHVGHQLRADRHDHVQLGRRIALGRHGPHAAPLFAEEQAVIAVVGHAAFGLRINLEAAQQLAAHLVAIGHDAVLQEGAVLVVDERFHATVRRAVQAHAVDVFQAGIKRAGGSHRALCIDGENHHAVVVALGSHCHVELAVADLDVLAHIDVVQTAHFQQLQLLALQVVHQQTLLLVGAEDARTLWIGRIAPDGRIVGGVAGTRNRFGLAARHDDGFSVRFCCGGGPGRRAHLPAGRFFAADGQLQFAVGSGADYQLLGALDIGVRGGHGIPSSGLLAQQVQLLALGVEHGDAARQDGQCTCAFFQRAVRLLEQYRCAAWCAFGIGVIGPQAGAIFAHQQLVAGVVSAAVLAVRGQGQLAYRQTFVALHHPLLGLAILGDQEQVVELLGIAVQAGGFDTEGGCGERRLGGEGACAGIDQDGYCLFGVGVHDHGQGVGAERAGVEVLGAD